MKIVSHFAGHKHSRLVLAAAFIFGTAMQSVAQSPQFTGHYPAGSEGLKAATLPPPGLYFRDYNTFYYADRFPGGPPDFKVWAYVNAPRLIWMTPWKILGGDYGMDVLIPLGYSEVTAPGLSDKEWSVGDVYFAPIDIAWHPKRFDFAVAYGFWAPSGNYDPAHPARLGKGFWSQMFTAGATWYPDDAKKWSMSVLNRYEIQSENTDLHITPGNAYTMEWGIGRSVAGTLDVGAVGYWQWQTTKDTHTGASGVHDQVVGLGPEIGGVIPKIGVIATLRYLREFEARDRPEGNTVTLTLTKRF